MKTIKWVGRTLFLEPVALRLVMMVTLLFAAIPPVQAVIGPYVKILLAWGALVLAADVFTRRRALRNRYAGFLLLFMLSYAVSIYLNRAAGVSENLSAFLYTIVFFFVLFAYDPDLPPEQAEREVRVLARVFVAVTALLALACLCTFLFSINYRYIEPTAPQYITVVVIGMAENRLYGLYNANTGAMLNLLSSAFSLLLLSSGSRRVAARVAHGLNLALQYICLILTLSRTAWFMYAALMALFVFFVLPRRAYAYPRAAEAVRGVVAVAAAAAVILLSVPVKAVMAHAPAAVQSVTGLGPFNFPDTLQEPTAQEPAMTPDSESPAPAPSEPAPSASTPTEPSAPAPLHRVEDTDEVGLLSGRTELWRGGWHAFLSHPFFGTTRAGLYAAAQEYVAEQWRMDILRGGLHNIALMVLACSGGVGFVILLAFVLFSGGRALKWMWRRRGDRAAALGNMLIVMLITILGTEMLESRILYTVTIFGAVFWTMYGYAMRLVDACEPEKAAHTGVYNRLARRFGKGS